MEEKEIEFTTREREVIRLYCNILGLNEERIKRLKFKLEEEVDKALNFLAPKFGISKRKITGLGRPKILFDFLLYMGDLEGDTIRFDPGVILKEPKCLSMCVGEEVGHWLHSQINKGLKLSCPYKRILKEAVGHYAALIYVSNNNETQKVSARKDEEELKRGWEIADKLFQKYGGSLLARISQMSITEAQEMLPNLLN